MNVRSQSLDAAPLGSLSRRPARHGGLWLSARQWLIVAAILPTIIATAYYGLIASDRYVTEANFVARGISSRRATGLDMFFQTFGIAQTADDAHAVQSYMLSRDAVRALDDQISLRAMFGREEADLFARFPRFWRGNSFERLYDYYLDRVTVIQETSKGITLLRVVAFTPEDAQRIASALLRLGEGVVNRMNARAQADAMKNAEATLRLAEQRMLGAQRELTLFRTKEGMIDPTKASSAVLETITTLATELAHASVQAQELESTSASSPALPVLRAKIASLRATIEAQRGRIAGDEGAIAAKLAVFDQLTLARELAERALTGANVSLETARQEAQRQAIYLEEIVTPNLADHAIEPQRLRTVATVLVLSLALVAVGWLLVAGAKEHSVE